MTKKRKRSLVQRLAGGRLGRWFPRLFRPREESRIDLSRRALILAGLSGFLLAGLFRLRPEARGRRFEPRLIRPPGSLPERDFLERCVKCGQCMAACPNNALHPTWDEAGIEGVWSPVLRPRMGYCEYECTLCTQVCPTGAIRELTVEEKKEVHIGTAFIDPSRCLPHAIGRECIVCEEHCPIPDKAIWLQESEFIGRDGTRMKVRLPRVDVDLCNGCGACENKCPLADLPAIRVTSGGETRHPENQFSLQF